MTKLILVDDHQILREGLKFLLAKPSANLQVVAEAGSALDLFPLLEQVEADIVLLDLNLPGMDGLEATRYLKVHYPALKVLIFSVKDQELDVAQALEAGADGYLAKSCSHKELLLALQLIATGNKYFTPYICLKLLGKEPESIGPVAIPEILSKRELEVLQLIAEGYTAEKIANKIFTSKRTVETHRQNILEKTKTKNTANLISYAVRHQLLD